MNREYFSKEISKYKNIFRGPNERSKNLTSRVVTSVRPIRPDFEFSSGVWLRHPRIQGAENGPSFFLDRLSLGKNCTMSRYEVRKVFHSQWRETREREEESLMGGGGWIASPWSHRFTVHLVRAFVRHLSYNLLRCCYTTIHDTRDTRFHILWEPWAFLFASRGLTETFFSSDHILSHFNDLYPIQKNK